MNNIKILLSNTNDVEKCKAANNIIVNYELPLDIEKILLLFEKSMSLDKWLL